MYAYDPQLSIQLAKNHPELFEMRACYNNVYNMVMQHLEELTPWEKLRILFCYRKGNGEEMSVSEYLDLLCLERETPLRTVLQEEERAAIKAHGLTLNSFDQSQLNSL